MFPHCLHLCFRCGSVPFPAPSISHNPEGQPTGVYILNTRAWLPELGMLKRPGLAFFSFQLWQLSHPHPEGAGPHRSLGVSKREEIIPLSRRKRGRGASWAAQRSGGASKGRARGRRALGAAQSRGPRMRGRARPSEGALSEGTCAGARPGSGRGVAGWLAGWLAGGAGRGGAAAARGRRAPPGFLRLRRGHQLEGGGRCTQSLKTWDLGGAEGRRSGTWPRGRSARCSSLLSRRRFPRSI